jgi:hypothetical protein
MFLFSSSDALDAYRKTVAANATQHYLKTKGVVLFGSLGDDVDRVWIDIASPHDIYYMRDQFQSLRDMVEAIVVEDALAGLRKGAPPENAMQTAREYKNYYVPVTRQNNRQAFIMAPDTKGRSLAAAFTSDDTFDAFLPEARQMADGGEVEQMQIDGEALFDTFQRMKIDGFVFNCSGPVTPVAFQQGAAGLILQG